MREAAALRAPTRRALAVALAAVAAFCGLAAPALGAGSGRLVTFVARVCPAYTDINANRARNNIMESLANLGPDTPYAAGQPISPEIEDRTQPNCRPLPDWQLTLGTGYRSRAVSGYWGSLSIVTSPYDTSIITKPSVPLLDANGRPVTGGKTIGGATTIELTQAQADRARQANSLWVQGGTPTHPILDDQFPNQYGFGALRCSEDDLNGDNVEWITFPTGSTHAFCFVYYVQPPPTAGTIVVEKRISGVPPTARETFPFSGNLSFNPGGKFTLTPTGAQPASQTFIRAETRPGDAPWQVREDPTAGWSLTDLQCRSAQGNSTTTVDRGSATASISLAAGDTVTCSYANAARPPDGQLLLRKITTGAVGTAEITARATSATVSSSITTTQEGVPAAGDPHTLPPGPYDLDETLPTTKEGTWALTGVDCDGNGLGAVTPVRLDVAPGGSHVCTFTNAFTPAGSITIDKVSLPGNGTGPTGFAISPVDDPAVAYAQTANVERENDPTRAVGDDTSALGLGKYVIQEMGARRTQQVVEVRCNGKVVPFAAGQISIALTESEPGAHCVFFNQTLPSTGEPPPAAAQTEPEARIGTLSKTVAEPAIVLGETQTYRIRATNPGPAHAVNVVIVDQPDSPAVLVDARAEHGSCAQVLPVRCVIPDVAPGEQATVTVLLRPTAPGVFRNFAVLGLQTADPNVSRDRDATRSIVARRRARPSLTG